jgi:hypothetical protein
VEVGKQKSDTIGMESKEKLELAKALLQNAENMHSTSSQDPLYGSLSKGFDVQKIIAKN